MSQGAIACPASGLERCRELGIAVSVYQPSVSTGQGNALRRTSKHEAERAKNAGVCRIGRNPLEEYTFRCGRGLFDVLMDAARALAREAVEGWLKDVVLAHGLCPFAVEPAKRETVHIQVADAKALDGAIAEALLAAHALLDQPESDTTLLVFPFALDDFEDFLDMVDACEAYLEDRELGIQLQTATFHPEYRFDGVAPNAASNFTNRSPLPVLQWLRTEQVSDAVDSHGSTETIPERNIAHMESLSTRDLESLRSLPGIEIQAGILRSEWDQSPHGHFCVDKSRVRFSRDGISSTRIFSAKTVILAGPWNLHVHRRRGHFVGFRRERKGLTQPRRQKADGVPMKAHKHWFISLFLCHGALSLGCARGGTLPAIAVEHNTAGAEYLVAGELDDAEARFRLALEYQPGFAESRANLGLVAFQRGNLDDAEGHLRSAIRLDANFDEAWSNLGLVLSAKGRLQDAKHAFEAALAIDPGLVAARRNIADLNMRRGDYEEARAHLMRLVQIVDSSTPDGARASSMLAYCELRLDRQEEALYRAQIVSDRPARREPRSPRTRNRPRSGWRLRRRSR